MLAKNLNFTLQRGAQHLGNKRVFGSQQCRPAQRSRWTGRSRGSLPDDAGPDKADLATAELGAGQDISSLGQDAGSAGPVAVLQTTPGGIGGASASTRCSGNNAASSSNSSVSGAEEAGGSLLQENGVEEMLMFALPALGIVLCEPLMSLIDTACVGRVSSVQLAALGPNTAIFNFVFQVFAFLSVATTSTIASNSPRAASLGAGARAARVKAAQTTLSNALVLAVASGFLATAALLTQGTAFLAAMGTPGEVLAPALQYLRIRALASPAVMVMSVSQGACLGQQDVWAPAGVLGATGLLSAVGDIYLIAYRGAGIAGAAAATAAAQYVGAAFFLWHLWRKGKEKDGIPLKFMGMPSWETMQPFFEMASTLFVRTIFGMAAYLAMTTAATRLGTLSAATHQVAMQVLWFLTFIPEPLSLAAQSLIARDRYNPAQASQWAWLLLKAGTALGFVLAATLAGIFEFGTWIFTTDVAVQRAIASLAPVGVLATLVCSTNMMLDGISIGAADFRHLPAANAVGLGLTFAILAAGKRMGLGLHSVWWALVGFYGARLATHVLHLVNRGQGSVFAGGGSEGASRQQKYAQSPA